MGGGGGMSFGGARGGGGGGGGGSGGGGGGGQGGAGAIGGGDTQWATGGTDTASMPMPTPQTSDGTRALRESIDSLNMMSLDSVGGAMGTFATAKASMPARAGGGGRRRKGADLPSLALGGSHPFVFDPMNSILSPGAEQLAKISTLFKTGSISNAQRSQMKDKLYLSMSQEALLS